MGDVKDELRTGARAVLGAAIAAGVRSFSEWVRTRPIKRAIERRRARKGGAPPPSSPPPPARCAVCGGLPVFNGPACFCTVRRPEACSSEPDRKAD